MKILLSIVAILAWTTTASAQAPEFCDVVPSDYLVGMVFAPDSPTPLLASVQEITVRNDSNEPMPGVLVQLVPSSAVSVCRTLWGVTDDQGEVTIVSAGGGCDLSGKGVQVIANDVVIRSYSVRSPDFDGAGGDLDVNLSDVIFMTNCVLPDYICPCLDFDDDGLFDLGDLVWFAQTFIEHNVCP